MLKKHPYVLNKQPSKMRAEIIFLQIKSLKVFIRRKKTLFFKDYMSINFDPQLSYLRVLEASGFPAHACWLFCNTNKALLGRGMD